MRGFTGVDFSADVPLHVPTQPLWTVGTPNGVSEAASAATKYGQTSNTYPCKGIEGVRAKLRAKHACLSRYDVRPDANLHECYRLF